MLDAADALNEIVVSVAPTFHTFELLSLSNIIHPWGTFCKP